MATHAHSTPASALLRAVPMSLWPVEVRERRRCLLRQVRTAERLLFTFMERLDELTPNPDLEDGGDDEPSLCGVGAQHMPFTGAAGPYIDVEDQADAEELLGWSEGASLTGRLGMGTDEREAYTDDREPDCGAEPDTNSAGYL